MKSLSLLCLLVLMAAVGCSDKKAAETTEAAPVLEVPAGKEWQVTVDGGGTHGSKSMLRKHVSGKLTVMGTAGPGGSGIILVIPMATPNETGTFTKGVKVTLPGVPNVGTCKHVDGVSDSTASVEITRNTATEFAATFEFKDFGCKQKGVKLSGSGSVTEKN